LTAGIEMHEEQLSELEETAIMLAEIPIDGSGEKPADKPTSPIKAHMHNRRKSQAQAAASKPQKLVPMAYWDVVVGIGIGILWSREKGVVQEIPAALLQGGRKKFASNAKTKPHLKNRGKGSEKPKMKVERDDMHGFD
jgi:hypothetical protein